MGVGVGGGVGGILEWERIRLVVRTSSGLGGNKLNPGTGSVGIISRKFT